MKIYGVVMAGGGGTRFWPLSRHEKPKQFLNLSGKDLMINETLDRLFRITDRENVFIVGNAGQADALKRAVGDKIPESNIILEPSARNTSACIGYAAMKILSEKGDGVMVVVPSDAYVKDEKTYAATLKKAAEKAENGGIVTVGIKPCFAATGYGYIRFSDGEGEIKKVDAFVEKPDADTAERYLKEGNYLWNGGIFVWKVSVACEKIKKYLPDVYAYLNKIRAAVGTEKENETVDGVYPLIRSVSIDYGVMEKADDIFVIKGDFGWNDVGSLDMMDVLHEKDENGNVLLGNVTAVDSFDTTVYASSGRTVAVLGLENVIVAEMSDVVLVCPKDRAQDVRKIVERLKEEGKTDIL